MMISRSKEYLPIRKNGNSLNLLIIIFNIFSLIELYRYKKIDLIFVPATAQ